MKNKILFFVSLPLCAGLAQAQERTVPPESSTACHTLISGGAGVTFFGVCFSPDGNIVRFETPAGRNHLVASEEGYAVCATGAPVYYDAGVSESGWGAPIITQPGGPNTLPLTIVRNTTDGRFQLRQVFSRDASELDITVTMTLFNVSGLQQTGVRLDRYADFNIGGTFPNDLLNKTLDAVFGKDNVTSDGIMLVAPSVTTPAHTTAVHGYGSWVRNSCNQTSAAVPTAVGDHVARISHNIGTMAIGANRSVKAIYRRF